MLKELKFVQGAVAKKDFLPVMTHFQILKGFVTAYNGTLSLRAPLPIDLECKPKAAHLVQAIAKCSETTTLNMTENGKLRVQSGKFKAFIDCIEEEFPNVEPEGDTVQIDGEQLIKSFKTLYDFIGEDASRPWSNGILLRGQSAFATNNVCLVEYWLGFNFPVDANIPMVAVREIIRIGEVPTHIRISDKNITFLYENGKWIRSQLFSTQWPNLSKVLDRENNATIINKKLFEGLEVVAPFVDKLGRIYFSDNCIKTHSSEAEGASFELENFEHKGIYQIEMLKLLTNVVDRIDFNAYPEPCIFYGDRLRGAIIGMTGL